MKSRSWLMVLLLSAGMGVGVACAEAKKSTDVESPTAELGVAAAASPPVLPPIYNPMQSLAPLVEKLQAAVVNIDIEQKVAVQQMPQMFGQFFGMPNGQWPQQQDGQDDGDDGGAYRKVQGSGSGFVISEDGYILTNNHVVAEASKVRVRMADKRSFEAHVIGTDDRTDIALVKIDTTDKLPYVRLGDSDPLKVGDWVVAIGNPYGLGHTVTAGIVSAKGRVIGAGPYDDFIQTDASINPGNSGGPLFNLAGEVVGINTAVVRSATGIGFAVPVDMIKPVIDDLKTSGHVARGWMGLGLQELDPDLASALQAGDAEGVVVSQIYPGFPAADAGLQSQDIITAINDQPMSSSEALVRAVGAHKPGETVSLDVLRDGKARVIKVKLAERPDEKSLAAGNLNPDSKDRPESSKEGHKTGGTALSRMGLSLEPAARYRATAGLSGLVVTGVDGEGAADGKLGPGDIITEVNGQTVTTVEEANKAIEKGGDTALFVVSRERSQRLVAVPRNK